ncbi:hypothetical protein PR202_ga17949 [Eleusine coracana subsp. coracana]|uniref:Calcineurin-like phosphoesterase domain-containing protein n=1 Tax=Eleusine coracana subsp. coracana TaxID=191504 RepID=A0AAV5CSD1_ELECO|nr:hypothetical protein PR202_ga17949 [Eleusine coracana subsp. coracana]
MDSVTGTGSGAVRRRVRIAVDGRRRRGQGISDEAGRVNFGSGSFCMLTQLLQFGLHNDWALEEDSKALQILQISSSACSPLYMTGDYGNENVQLVQSISDLQFPKAAILGDHDCWHTHQFSDKKVDRVRLQLGR